MRVKRTTSSGGNGSAKKTVEPSDLVRSILAARGRDVVEARRKVLRRGDGKSIHVLRVATRRLQATLEIFASCLPEEERDRVDRRARKIRRRLGTRRNTWVLRQLLGRFRAGSLPGEWKFMDDLARQLKESEASADPIDRGALPGIRGRMKELLREAVGRTPPAARTVLRDRLGAVLSGRSGAARARPEAMHRLRISIKRYRYALEVLAEAGVAGLEPAIADARGLQRELGRLHDLDVLIEVVRKSPRAPGARLFLSRVQRRRSLQARRALNALATFHPARAAGPGTGGRPRGVGPAAPAIQGAA
jgi:CHAD domain-containing protein